MANEPRGVRDAEVALASDRDYEVLLTAMIRRARRRIRVSMFIVDLVRYDPALRVLGVLHELAAARWRSVDVQMLIGGSRKNLDIAQSAATGLAVARRLVIPTRWMTARDVRGSHAKYIVADDEVMLGSHNWSPSAFASSTQDSLWLHSPELAAAMCDAFAAQWLRPPRATV
jgi:phosphatidylserine/phosphatidylglycerophosphate/cardiolipin synthase-like enzyme